MAYTTRKSLIKGIQANDESSWNEFFQFYENYIKNVVYGMGYYLSDSEKDEIVQNVMVSIHARNNPEVFDKKAESKYKFNRSKFRTWLSWLIKTAVRQVIRARIKQNQQTEFQEESEADLPDLAPAEAEALEKTVTAKALEILTTKTRTNAKNIEAFQMVVFGGIPVAEVCRNLEMSENQVHQAVCRCRKVLMANKAMLLKEM